MGGSGATWRGQRAPAIAAHTAELVRQRAADTAQARQLLADFVHKMTDPISP